MCPSRRRAACCSCIFRKAETALSVAWPPSWRPTGTPPAARAPFDPPRRVGASRPGASDGGERPADGGMSFRPRASRHAGVHHSVTGRGKPMKTVSVTDLRRKPIEPPWPLRPQCRADRGWKSPVGGAWWRSSAPTGRGRMKWRDSLT